MNTNRLTKKQGKDSLLQLLFLINPLTKEIKFSNQPLVFEMESPVSGILSFLHFAENNEEAFMEEWEKCLLLNPGQSRLFETKVMDSVGQTVRVVLHATGVQMTGEPQAYVLFNIERGNTGADEWKNRFEQLSASFDLYKKEYTGFIDIATHDLDAPLRKLSTFIDRLTIKLSATSQKDEIQEYLTRIDACLGDMRSLINDLSDLSRIISKQREHTACNIETIIQEIISEMQPRIKEKKAIFSISTLPVIEGDMEQLTLLFKNLLENAMTFSKKDIAPKITIRSSELTIKEKEDFSLDVNSRYYKLEVADNGIGFRQEYAEKIFQPFHRLHGKSQFPGNGIGLAVCKKVIDNHQGIIYAEGVENSGACFIIILPQTTHQTC